MESICYSTPFKLWIHRQIMNWDYHCTFSNEYYKFFLSRKHIEKKNSMKNQLKTRYFSHNIWRHNALFIDFVVQTPFIFMVWIGEKRTTLLAGITRKKYDCNGRSWNGEKEEENEMEKKIHNNWWSINRNANRFHLTVHQRLYAVRRRIKSKFKLDSGSSPLFALWFIHIFQQVTLLWT